MDPIQFVVDRYNYWIFIVLMMVGLYTVIARGNLVKKIIGLNIFQTSVFIYYISIGKITGGTAPIYTFEHQKALFGGDHGGGEHDGTERVHHEAADGKVGHDVGSHEAGANGASAHAAQDFGALHAGAANDPAALVAGGAPGGAPGGASGEASGGVVQPGDLHAGAANTLDHGGQAASHDLTAAADLIAPIYSNPLPHVLILTAIVVGIATTAVGLALAVRIREAYGTIEEDELEAADNIAEFGVEDPRLGDGAGGDSGGAGGEAGGMRRRASAKLAGDRYGASAGGAA